MQRPAAAIGSIAALWDQAFQSVTQAARNSSGPTGADLERVDKYAVGTASEKAVRVGLPHWKRQIPDILTVDRQYIEGAELDLAVLFAGMQRIEIGDAVDAQDHGLAIDDELLTSKPWWRSAH